MNGAVLLEAYGLELLPERAAFHARSQTLYIADCHWGKAATFRALAFAVPEGTMAADLARLSRALEQTAARRLVVLGDLLHARAGRQPSVLQQINDWRSQWPDLRWELIRGNHDRSAGDPPSEWQMLVRSGPLHDGPFVLAHEPPAEPDDAAATDALTNDGPQAAPLVLCGHVHPTVLLRGPGRESLRLPCFHLTQGQLILPAFSALTDGYTIQPVEDDGVWAIAEDTVFAAPLVNRPASSRRRGRRPSRVD